MKGGEVFTIIRKLTTLFICLIVFSSSQLILINGLPNLQDQNKSIKIVSQEQPIRIMGDPNPSTH
ncbi:hypothetical protein JCM11672_25240 [Alkaliphilus crotonatoxidans]